MIYLNILALVLIVASFDAKTTFGKARECDCKNIVKRNASVPTTATKQQQLGRHCEEKCKANNVNIEDYAVGNQKDLETKAKGRVFITCLYSVIFYLVLFDFYSSEIRDRYMRHHHYDYA